MSDLVIRLNGHFAAMAAVGAVAAIGGVAQNAEAAVVYSGVLNTPITANIDGIYVNLVSGATGTSSSSVPGNDINPYSSGGTWVEFARTGSAWITAGSAIIDATGLTIDGTTATTTAGTAFGSAFANTAIMGLKFTGDDALTHYGWVRLTLPGAGTAGATAGTLVDYAYDSTPDTAIVGGVPAPTAGMGVLALGGLGLLGRRRKN